MTDLNFNNIEEMLELLDSKTVKTQQGTYIRVEDLTKLNRELAEARKTEAADKPKYKGFEAAKKAAKEDPEFAALFEQKPARAPALDGQAKNVAEKETPHAGATA